MVAGTKRTKGRSASVPPTEDHDVLWAHFQDDTNFFQNIKIDRLSGRDEVSHLIRTGRQLEAFVGFAFGWVNFAYVMYNNLSVLSPPQGTQGLGECPDGAFIPTSADANGNAQYECKHFFTYTGAIVTAFGFKFGDTFTVPTILAIVELAVLAYAVLRLFYYLVATMCNARSSPRKRWMTMARLFCSAWPAFATATSIKLLYYVQTTIVVQAVVNLLSIAFSKNGAGCLAVLGFLVKRIFCGLVGLDTFLFKAQRLAFGFQAYITVLNAGGTPAASTLDMLLNSFVTINQLLGVVQLGRYSRRRIFVFMFAGENGEMSPRERAIKEIWEGMFAMWCWQQLKWHQAISVYLSYTDYDFQKLVLDNKEPATDSVELPIL